MSEREDRLELMLTMQHRLQAEAYHSDPDLMSDEEKIQFIQWNVLALTDELHEALGEIGWKPWASSRHINKEALQGELVDAWHFMMNLMIAAELSPPLLLAKYVAKNAVNAQRQKDGYDGVSTKCRYCGRALDDPGVNCRRSTNDQEVDWCETYGHGGEFVG